MYNWQKWFGSGNKDGFYSQIGERKLCCKTQVGWATQSYAAMQPACVVNICSLQLVLPVNNWWLQMGKWAAQSFLNLVNSFFRFFISTMIYQLSFTYSRYQTKAGVKKVLTLAATRVLLIFITEDAIKEKSSYITSRRFQD